MLRLPLIRLLLIFTCITLPLVSAQTDTVANPNVPGGSIIEVVTTDINGLPVTQIAGTVPPGQAGQQTTAIPPPGGGGAVPPTTTPPGAIPPTTTTPAAGLPTTTTPVVPTTTTKAVAAPVGQGPVAQPAPTVPVGQGITSYQYTTVDALGQTTVIQDIFTPTYNTPSPPSSPVAGTVLGMSAWSTLIGTHTAGGPTNGGESWRISRTSASGMLALTCGVVAGAFAVL